MDIFSQIKEAGSTKKVDIPKNKYLKMKLFNEISRFWKSNDFTVFPIKRFKNHWVTFNNFIQSLLII